MLVHNFILFFLEIKAIIKLGNCRNLWLGNYVGVENISVTKKGFYQPNSDVARLFGFEKVGQAETFSAPHRRSHVLIHRLFITAKS